jgi:hypothetical protein
VAAHVLGRVAVPFDRGVGVRHHLALGQQPHHQRPARPRPSSTFLDQSRCDLGKSQPIWTDSEMGTAGSRGVATAAHNHEVRMCRQRMGSLPLALPHGSGAWLPPPPPRRRTAPICAAHRCRGWRSGPAAPAPSSSSSSSSFARCRDQPASAFRGGGCWCGRVVPAPRSLDQRDRGLPRVLALHRRFDRRLIHPERPGPLSESADAEALELCGSPTRPRDTHAHPPQPRRQHGRTASCSSPHTVVW